MTEPDMSLRTKFMGMELKSPVIAGSSSLTNSADNLKLAEDCGAGAIVIKSLFEEQILVDSGKSLKPHNLNSWYSEAVSNIENYSESILIEHYLNLIYFAKNELSIPVFASINCISDKDWPQFAMKFEEAGAEGIELNIAVSPSDNVSTGDDVTRNIVNIINAVRANCTIPVSVKLSPYFTNTNSAIRLISETGVEGIVVFNRLFTPDIDIDTMSGKDDIQLSSESDIKNSLRWITLLSQDIKSDMIGSGGVYDYQGIVKYLLAGARGVQVTSSLLKNGIEYISELNSGLKLWMETHEFQNIDEFRGIISKNKNEKKLFNQIQYLRLD